MNYINAEELFERLILLESRQAFQEDTIETLNQSIIQYQQQLARLQEQLQLLAKKIQSISPSMVASQIEETPPPHY